MKMTNTTLCYIEKDDAYLMLHRVKKEHDLNRDKWIGVGGKFEEGETPEECLLREVKEETGLTLTDYRLRGIVTFVSQAWGSEYMYLYTAEGFIGELSSCDEGELVWVPKTEISNLNLWEGDRLFLRLLEDTKDFFSMKLRYEGFGEEEGLADHSVEFPTGGGNGRMILFDLDGTLVDSSEGVCKCVQYALDHYGIYDQPDAVLKTFIGPPLTESFEREYGFDRDKQLKAVAFYRERYRDTGIYECKLYPGVKESIQRLKKAGFRIGMASSKPEGFCRRILSYFGIDGLFDEIVGATEDGRISNKIQVLEEAFRREGSISRDKIFLVGDTIFDVEGANAAGIRTLAVTFGFGDREQMMEAGALGPCDSMEEVADFFLGKKKNADF